MRSIASTLPRVTEELPANAPARTARPIARVAFAVLALVTSVGTVTSFMLGWEGSPGALGFAAGLFLTPLDQLQFFTFLSNTLVLITSLQLVVARDWSRTWHVLRIAGITCIIITGVVFNLLLAGGPLVGISELNDIIVHRAVPILAPLVWLCFGPRATTWRRVLLAALLPIAWLIVTLVRGASSGWYPYSILDVNRLGYDGVSVYIVSILAFYFVLATIMWLVDRHVGGIRGPRLTGRDVALALEGQESARAA